MDTPSRHGVTEADREPAPAPLRFERRLHDRWSSRGTATAYRVAGQRFGERHVLRLLDESYEGLGALTSRPLEPGAVVSVGFATLGHPAKSGVVLRCAPCGDGYRVAIRFETRMAA
ncbi:MAG: hypothetical protein ACYTE6_05310 [Planctomycetota bacterium]